MRPAEARVVAGVVGRVAALGRATVPDQVYVALRPRLEKLLGMQEPELAHLMRKRSGRWGRRFVDVGANWGSYSVLLGPRFARVDAFEPLARCATALRRYASSFGVEIDVHECALSDRSALLPFLIPQNDTVDRSGMSRIAASVDSSTVSVEAKTLDSFAFDDVDLIKIDVESHEREVISGAAETLRRCRPTLLVEIEQRQFVEPFRERVAFIEQFGYRTSFLKDGEVRPATEFVLERDQDPANFNKRGRYVNNFLFEPIIASSERP